MQRSRYLGRGQIAVCMRSGIKCHASELVHDGRIPSLLVLPEWADPPQPQERPYVPNDLEGAPRFEVSPDVTPIVAPVLSGELESSTELPSAPELTAVLDERTVTDPITATISWTESTPAGGDSVESYSLWRSEVADNFELYAELDADTFSYQDTALSPGVTFKYFVVTNAVSGEVSNQSNTAEVTP